MPWAWAFFARRISIATLGHGKLMTLKRVPLPVSVQQYLIRRQRIELKHSSESGNEFMRAECFLIFRLVYPTCDPKKQETQRRQQSQSCVAGLIGYRSIHRLSKNSLQVRWGPAICFQKTLGLEP